VADVAAGLQGGDGVAFLVSAGIVFEICAWACSSPQTAEINIGTRAGTLMKWVHVGSVLGLAFILIAAAIERNRAHAILAGGLVAIACSEIAYRHAKASGLARPGPMTEGGY